MSGSNSSPPAAKPGALDEPLGLTVHSLPSPQRSGARPTRSAPRAGRWKMLAVLLVCAAPVIASYFTYYVVRPEGRRNYGELIDPQRPLPALTATTLRRQAGAAAVAQGPVAAGQRGRRRLRRRCARSTCTCSASCARAWARRRTGSTGSGWSPTTRPCADALQPALAQATVLRVTGAQLAQWLAPAPGQQLADHLYVVDPHGQLDDALSRRPWTPPARAKAKRDLERLLRASAAWDKAGPAGSPWTRSSLYDLAPAPAPACCWASWSRSGRWPGSGCATARPAPARRLQALTAADAVPHLRPGAVRRLHAPDRFGPGLPRLARLLRQRQPGRRARARSARRRPRMPTGPGHARQGLDRDGPPLPRHRRRRADHRRWRSRTWLQRKRGASPVQSLVARRSRWSWVCLQGAFGALTVTMKLFPAIVTLHLLGGLVLLALLCRAGRGATAQAAAAARAGGRRAGAARAGCSRPSRCSGCRSRWAAGSAPTTRCWPATSSRPARAAGGRRWISRQGFELWRELGKTRRRRARRASPRSPRSTTRTG